MNKYTLELIQNTGMAIEKLNSLNNDLHLFHNKVMGNVSHAEEVHEFIVKIYDIRELLVIKNGE